MASWLPQNHALWPSRGYISHPLHVGGLCDCFSPMECEQRFLRKVKWSNEPRKPMYLQIIPFPFASFQEDEEEEGTTRWRVWASEWSHGRPEDLQQELETLLFWVSEISGFMYFSSQLYLTHIKGQRRPTGSRGDSRSKVLTPLNCPRTNKRPQANKHSHPTCILGNHQGQVKGNFPPPLCFYTRLQALDFGGIDFSFLRPPSVIF